MNLGRIFFYLVMYLHIIACYWFLVIHYNGPENFFRYVDEGNIYKNNMNDAVYIEEGSEEPF
jgi:hypothetical protein